MGRGILAVAVVCALAGLGATFAPASRSAAPASAAVAAEVAASPRSRPAPAPEPVAPAEREAHGASAAAASPLPAPPPPWPDLTQTDEALGFAGGGASHCGPVAAANGVAHLAAAGLPALLPDGADLQARHVSLARALASRPYMATDVDTGTSAEDLLEGLARYVADAGYRVARLEYAGWRDHPRERSARMDRPTLDFVRSGLGERSFALLHVGWYHRGSGIRYRRKGGHWVTVVGAAHEGEGRDAIDTLLVHDPAPSAGLAPATERVRVEVLREGWVRRPERSAIEAAGFLRLGEGMHLKDPTYTAIVDGAVVLEVDAP